MSGSATETHFDLIVAGGGAAGFFGAITCAEAFSGSKVLILEKSREVLGKVKISGGGRCNVTHGCFDPSELVSFYPRGSKALIGPFHRWGPTDTMEWYESRGVPLKIEEDGRVFPQSDSSQSIIDCLTSAARDAGVEVRTLSTIESVKSKGDEGFEVLTKSGVMTARRVLLTLGGTRSRFGAELAESFGHRVHAAAPSLFTFKIDDARIDGLQGLSVPDAEVRIPQLKLEARGPVLITHWGLSGPGILKVSAWGARELQACDYRFEVRVNWTGGKSIEQVVEGFSQQRERSKKKLLNDPQFGLPARLWKRLVEAAVRNADDLGWSHLSKKQSRDLAAQIVEGTFAVAGKSMNKDEFVTCGGVHLADVNFKTMESRKTPGMYFAGEMLDIDGVTGGFNFQAAWTTSRIAGEAIAESMS